MLRTGIHCFQNICSRRASGIVLGGVRSGSSIEVILLQDLDRKGVKGDIVRVKRGLFL